MVGKYLKNSLAQVFIILGIYQPVFALSGASFPVIKDISTELENVQQGDWVFLDIDDTLLYASYRMGVRQVKEVNPNVKETIQKLRDTFHDDVKIFALTARPSQRNAQDDLASMGYSLDDVITAPGDSLKKCVKGDYLVNFIKSKKHHPQRIWFFDDTVCQLQDVQEKLSTDNELKQIPLNLYHFKFYRKF